MKKTFLQRIISASLSMMLTGILVSGITAFAQDEPTNEYFADDFSGFTAGSTLAVSAEHPAYTTFANASAVNLGEGRESVVRLSAKSGSEGKLQLTCPSLDKEWQMDFMFDRAWTEYSGLYFVLHDNSDNTQTTRIGVLPTVGWAQLQTIVPGQSMQWTSGFAASVNTWYTIKLRLRNNTVYAKLWKTSDSEPANWGYSLTGSGLSAYSADTLTLTAHEDGATTNTYIDNMIVRTWDTSKAPVYEDGNPKYTYLSDSFEDFATDTTLSVDENNPVYNGFNRASVVKYSDERPSVMKLTSASNNNGSMSILCPTLDKEWSFDLLYDANWDGYNGLYTVLHKEADGSACQFAFLPTAGNPNQRLQISVPGESLGWSAFTGLSANTWYTFKLRLRENVLSVKAYPAGTTEPDTWNYSKTISAALAKNDEDILSIMGAQGGGTVNTYIDNMKIMTWEEVKLPTVKIDEPEFIYYEDDFADYDEGTLEKHETKAVVSTLTRANISADGELVLSSDNQGHNSLISIALPKAEKRIDFDFKMSRASSPWGRLSVSLYSDTNGGYSYAVFPGATWGQGKHLQMMAIGTEQWLDGVATSASTWYSCTIQLRKNVMSVKIWDKNTEEPEAWTYSYTIPQAVGENDKGSITITNYEQDGGYNDVYIDNLVIKTWDEVIVDTAKVSAPANDSTMGSTTGGAEYLAGTSVTLEATAKRGYRFNGWKVGEEIVSTEEVYTFTATEDITVTAMFSKAVLEIKAITAVGQTLEPVIDAESKTATIRLASDTDLSAVNMFFYTDPDIEIEESNYLLDLSSGSATVGDWTVIAEKNDLMTEFYVDSTNGSDKNDGLSPDTAFKTIEKAISATSEIEEWTGDVVIKLAEGVYSPKETLSFNADNGAAPGFAIIFDGKDSEKTVISGGVRITDWTESDKASGAFEADISSLLENIEFARDLYVDGKRAQIARTSPITPTNWDACNDDELELVDLTYIATGSKAGMELWENKTDIELVFEQGWKSHVVPVDDIILEDGKTVIVPKYDSIYSTSNTGLAINDPNFIQNSIMLLDEPGEYYIDNKAGKVYYIPEDGKDIDSLSIVLPVLEKLIDADGSKDGQVYGLQFKNVSFKYTAYSAIHDGHTDMQANFITQIGKTSKEPWLRTPGALTFDYATGIRFESCSFEAMATTSVDFGIGMRASSIFANKFRNLGASALQIGGADARDAQPMSKYGKDENGDIVEQNLEPEPERRTKGILVLSNDITNIGEQLKGSVGIWVGYVSDTTVSHNTVTNLPYTGISAGWGWGNFDKAPDKGQSVLDWDCPSVLERIVIENNDVHDVMQHLYDGACIYTLSYMPGSIISGNLVYNSRHFGIYNDQGSGGYIEIAENIMYNCAYGAYFYHNSQNVYTARMKATEKSMYGNYFEWASSDDEHYNFVRNRAGTLDTAAMGKFAPANLVSELTNAPNPTVSDRLIKISDNAPIIKTADADGFDFDGRAVISLIGADGEVVLEASENEYGEIPCGFTNLPEGEYRMRIKKSGMVTYESDIVECSDGESIVLTSFKPINGDITESFDEPLGDGKVDVDDFIRVLRGFSDEASEQLHTLVDINADGAVNVSDIALVKKNFGKSSDDYE